MQLVIKQKMFSLRDGFHVFDENDNIKYMVKSELLSLGHKFHIYDTRGREVGVIRQKMMSLFGEFYVEIGGKQLGSIKKKFAMITPKYEVDFKGWKVRGDLMGWNYEIYDDFNQIARISKKFFHLTDTYVIDIFDGRNEIECLMLVLAIDAANCAQNNS